MKQIVCLLIDDDFEEAEIFQYALEEIPFPVKCINVKSGKEALTWLARHPEPDYIFLDMNMPKMGGKECMKQIKQINAVAHVPVVLYSNAFIESEKPELNSLGAEGFILKTASVFDLHNTLSAFFSTREKASEAVTV